MTSNMKAEDLGAPAVALVYLQFHFVWPDTYVAETAASATPLAAPHARGHYVRKLSLLNAITRNAAEYRINLHKRHHGSCSRGARRLPDSRLRICLFFAAECMRANQNVR